MEKIIESLKRSLQSTGQLLTENLNEYSTYTWQTNYPVAVVHEKHRIKEEEVVASLSSAELFLEDNVTPTHYNDAMIKFFCDNAPNYLKQVTLMCLEEQIHTSYTFKEKRPHDYWKKVENPGDFKAVIELSIYDEINDICNIETNLRDIMRRNKEVPSLKDIGFVWVAITPSDLDIRKILEHYFIEKFELIMHNDQIIYIGWNETLRDINMRYFVCPPLDIV